MFEIVLDNQADKFLRKCEKVLFNRIIEKLDSLKNDPVPHDAKRVQGYAVLVFRVRIGDYRVLYRINYDIKRVIVVKIDKRDKIYS